MEALGSLMALIMVIYGLLFVVGGSKLANRIMGQIRRTLWRAFRNFLRVLFRNLRIAIRESWRRWPHASGFFWGILIGALLVLSRSCGKSF